MKKVRKASKESKKKNILSQPPQNDGISLYAPNKWNEEEK